MLTNHRANTPVLVILSSLIVLLHAAGSTPAQADPQTSPATALQQACDVPGTPYFTEYYGTVTLDGAPAPAGTVVEAYSPRGDRAGCQEVITPGYYTYMRVYREDPNANPPIPGMKLNDEVTFKVNGNLAQSDPSPVIWSDDGWDQYPVNLSATLAACPYDFNDIPGVDIGDVGMIAGAWRATDADSLDRYNYNGNSFVDIEDIMTVAKHLGEPCP